MQLKDTKAFLIFEKCYYYTIGATFAVIMVLELYDIAKIAFTAAPYFWIILGLGILYVAFIYLICWTLDKYFPGKKV